MLVKKWAVYTQARDSKAVIISIHNTEEEAKQSAKGQGDWGYDASVDEVYLIIEDEIKVFMDKDNIGTGFLAPDTVSCIGDSVSVGYKHEYSERCKPRAGTIDAPEPLNMTKKRLCSDIKILRKDGTEIGSYDKEN